MMKFVLILALMFVSLGTVAFSATTNAIFTWDALTSPDAVGVRIYQATTTGSYTYGAVNAKCMATVPALTCTVPNIPDGKYFWVATAYDAAGNESGPSNEVTKTFDTTAPDAPKNLKITP
jgi:hypothetical protein